MLHGSAPSQPHQSEAKKSASEKLHFIHVGQHHGLEAKEPDKRDLNTTVSSQLNVGKVIREAFQKYPKCVLLVEAQGEDAKIDAFSSLFCEQMFDQGFPPTRGDLTKQQKMVVYQYRAPFILFQRGEIPHIFQTTGKCAPHERAQERMRIVQALSTTKKGPNLIVELGKTKVFQEIHEEVMAFAKRAAIKLYGTTDGVTVLSVFGSNHDLKPSCDKEGFTHEYVDTLNEKASNYSDIKNYMNSLKLESKLLPDSRTETMTATQRKNAKRREKEKAKKSDEKNKPLVEANVAAALVTTSRFAQLRNGVAPADDTRVLEVNEGYRR